MADPNQPPAITEGDEESTNPSSAVVSTPKAGVLAMLLRAHRAEPKNGEPNVVEVVAGQRHTTYRDEMVALFHKGIAAFEKVKREFDSIHEDVPATFDRNFQEVTPKAFSSEKNKQRKTLNDVMEQFYQAFEKAGAVQNSDASKLKELINKHGGTK